MEQMSRQQELKLAMNGRMCLMAAGIVLIFSAITSTLMYGINMIMIAREAANGTKEYVDVITQAGITTGTVRAVGVCLVLLALIEITAGLSGARFSNRVDKALIMKKIAIVLLVVEMAVQVFMFFTHSLSFGMLFTAIAYPLFLLWGASRLVKLAKADPKRVYAMQKQTPANRKAQQPTGSKKSLRERAMMHTDDAEIKEAKGEETEAEKMEKEK